MSPRGQRPEPRHRLGFRIALWTALGFFVLSWVTLPAWDLIWKVVHPDEPKGLAWYEGWNLGEFIGVVVMFTVFGLSLGSLVGWLAGQRTLRPLRQIAAEVAEPFGHDDPLPGPFDETGEDEIAQLATALNAMRARSIDLRETLTTRDQERREWIAQVSHDLRTPLTALVTCLDLLEARLRRLDADDPRAAELVEAARHDAERLEGMSKDLLRIAHLELQEDLETEAVLPGELVEVTCIGLEPLVTDRGLTLELDVEEDLPEIRADGRLVLRALENLVANSLRHASEQIALQVRRTADAVRFAVLDDGPGLPTDKGAPTFASLRKARSGADSTGLGLLVTERVARAHGGSSGCLNRDEGGAEVWFELPATV